MWFAVLLLVACTQAERVYTEVVLPGVGCEFGGLVVHQGIDRDRDGALDDDEIQFSDYLCESLPDVVLVAVEEPGENCRYGGLAVHAGPDRDRDGVLDPEEITRTEYVCEGISRLARTDVELAGENCAHGGVVVVEGPDWNRDAELGEDEIEETRYVCAGETVTEAAGVFLGSYTIHQLSDVDALAGLHTVTGDLRIEGTFEALSLPDLKVVGGTLKVGGEVGNPLLRELQMPALEWVGRGLWLEKNMQLEKLEAFAGLVPPGSGFTLTLADNPRLTDASGLGHLRAIGEVRITGDHPALDVSHFNLEEVADLTLSGTVGWLDLSALHAVRGALRTEGLFVEEVALPALVSAGDVALGATVERLSAPALQQVTGSVDLAGASAVREVDLRALERVGLHLDVTDAPALQTLRLDALADVGGRMQVIWTGLSALEAPALATVQKNLMVKQNKKLARVHLPSLGAVGENPTFAFDMTGDSALSQVSALPPLTIDGSLILRGTALEDLAAFVQVRAVSGGLEITGHPQVDCGEAQALVDAIGRGNIAGAVTLDAACTD